MSVPILKSWVCLSTIHMLTYSPTGTELTRDIDLVSHFSYRLALTCSIFMPDSAVLIERQRYTAFTWPPHLLVSWVTREPTFCEKHLRFWGRICLLGHRIIVGSPDIPISSCPRRRETVDLASILDVLGRTVVKPCICVHQYSCYDDFWKLLGQISTGLTREYGYYSAETCLR